MKTLCYQPSGINAQGGTINGMTPENVVTSPAVSPSNTIPPLKTPPNSQLPANRSYHTEPNFLAAFKKAWKNTLGYRRGTDKEGSNIFPPNIPPLTPAEGDQNRPSSHGHSVADHMAEYYARSLGLQVHNSAHHGHDAFKFRGMFLPDCSGIWPRQHAFHRQLHDGISRSRWSTDGEESEEEEEEEEVKDYELNRGDNYTISSSRGSRYGSAASMQEAAKDTDDDENICGDAANSTTSNPSTASHISIYKGGEEILVKKVPTKLTQLSSMPKIAEEDDCWGMWGITSSSASSLSFCTTSRGGGEMLSILRTVLDAPRNPRSHYRQFYYSSWNPKRQMVARWLEGSDEWVNKGHESNGEMKADEDARPSPIIEGSEGEEEEEEELWTVEREVGRRFVILMEAGIMEKGKKKSWWGRVRGGCQKLGVRGFLEK